MCIALQQFGKETNVIIGKSIAGDPFIIRKFTSGFVEATLIWTLEMDIYLFFYRPVQLFGNERFLFRLTGSCMDKAYGTISF